ncbi:MAG: spore coat protein CotH [Flavobacteriales bacterium]|jgi:spore coat protein H
MKEMKYRLLRTFLTTCAFAQTVLLFGQWTTNENLPVYPSNEVTTIRIEIAPSDLELIYFTDSLFSNHEYSANFIFESSQLTDTVENIGFRLRGNTSRLAEKKSFKVSFNTFTPGEKWNGLEKLNLNGEHNDPSILRTKLGWEMAQEAGLVAPHVAFTRLFINELYAGLYLNVEHYDEQFVERQFGSSAGNLFKCGYSADLAFISNNPEDYKIAPWNGTRTYELKTNRLADDYSGLAHFIDVLNNTSSFTLHCELNKVFDVKKYLRTLAYELVIGHWDGYVFNNNNFYLFQRPSDGKFEFIQYDIDNTAGIDWVGNDWTTQNIYNYGNNDRPLYDRLLSNDELRDQFSFFVFQFMTEFAPIEDIEARANQLLEMITVPGLEDEYRTLDYGFSDADFTNALNEAWGGHIAYGIVPYFENRYSSNYVQLETTEAPTLFDVDDNAPLIDGQLRISVTPESIAEAVTLNYRIDNGLEVTVNLNDQGSDGDAVSDDGIWESTFDLVGLGDCIEYTVIVTSNGVTASAPCATKVWITPANDGLVLNELMSDNQTSLSDEAGEYDDWFEIWNGNNAPVLPSNYWVSDNIDYPLKFKLAGNSIPENGFKLLWADQDDEQGENHTNFSLSNSGEELLVLKIQEGSPRMVDYIAFFQATADVSFGREVDGAPLWVNFESPTPNSENGIVSVQSFGMTKTLPYPNPTSGIVHLPRGENWTFHDLSGKLLSIPTNGLSANLASLAPGVYLLKSEEAIIRILKK